MAVDSAIANRRYSPETIGDDQSHEQQKAGLLDDGLQDTSSETLPTEANVLEAQDPVATEAAEGADAKFDNGTDIGVSPASAKSPFETAQTAYDRGYADGVAAGNKAAEAELERPLRPILKQNLSIKSTLSKPL